MRHTALLVAALVVVGFGAPAVVASPAAAPTDAVGSSAVQEADGNETANETAPGARLAGVVNVQGAEVEGEVAERSFGLQMAAAKSNASKAAVLANQTGDLTERVEELRERKQALEERRASGDISNGQYRAEMARVAAELSTTNRLLNRTAGEAARLPSSALTDAGVDATELQRLREAAGELSGPEMAEIARDIGGPPVNVTRGPPGNGTRGPPEDGPQGPPGDGDLPVDADDLPDGVSPEDVPENVTADQLENVTDGDFENVSVGDGRGGDDDASSDGLLDALQNAL
jgi:hypothetical protein